MQRKTIQGHFTKIDGSSQIGISETEARRLLTNHCRDVDEQIASLKGNPYGPVVGEGCKVMFEVHRAPVVTVDDGGPLLRKAEVMSHEMVLQFLLDLVLEHAPTLYGHYFGQFEMIQPAAYDNFTATLMEVLDNAAGPDITFTARQQEIAGETITTLGFWPLEE